jgi:hypothetical protein
MSDLVWNLPWSELQVPVYRPVTCKPWTLKKCEQLPQLGYFQDRQGVGDVYALFQDGLSWMTTAWDEIESQAPHIEAAQGHVVVMGCGMGVAVFNILMKPEVRRVTLVERDPVVVEILRESVNLGEWMGIEKLHIEIIDAFDYQPSTPVDHLYIDIWAKPGEPNALSDTQRIQGRVGAATAGWWSQEIHFLQWLEQKGYGTSPCLSQYREWGREIGLPLIGTGDPAYVASIPQVARSYCYRMFLQELKRTEDIHN